MSGFTALNVEPEDTLEEEVDDTKEIQIEEAFKLYQNALRLQSQGSGSYGEALEGYQQLFKSEVFKYSEVISEYAHDQLEEDGEPSTSQTDLQAIALPSISADSSANNLLQLIYLAHKNRGQFVLDVAHSQVQQDPQLQENAALHWTDATGKALGNFAEALERDDTDIDLWNKAARVAETLASHRIVRFCLESVLAGDDDAADNIDISGLDEAYAAEQLKDVTRILGDDLSQAQFPDIRTKAVLKLLLKCRNDPYAFLPEKKESLMYTDDLRRPINFKPVRHIMRPAKSTWTSLAQAILQALVGEQSNTIEFGPGGAIQVDLPDIPLPAASKKGGQVPNPLQNEGRAESSGTVMVNGTQEDSTMADEIIESPEKAEFSPKETTTDGEQTSQAQPDVPPGLSNNSTQALDRIRQNDVNPTDETPQAGSVSLPTRKRSSTAAGMEEPEARVKSKRLRARESMADGGLAEEDVVMNLVQYNLLETFNLADQWMFGTVNDLLDKIEVQNMGSSAEIRRDFGVDSKETSDPVPELVEPSPACQLLFDFKQALLSWSEEKSQAILYGHGNHDFGGGKAGLTLFLQHSKASAHNDLEPLAPEADDFLLDLVTRINKQWSTVHDISTEFLKALLCSGKEESAYVRSKWPDELKQTVVQIVVREDEHLYNLGQESFWNRQSLDSDQRQSSLPIEMLEFVEGMFELHLDIYCSITNPSSQVDQATRTQQQDRLTRWAELTSMMFNAASGDLENFKSLLLRFIFASATYGNKLEEDQHDHVNSCLQDLRKLLTEANMQSIWLPNNAAMPEISTTAVEQEISRLSTLDFFASIFDSDNSDAVEVIESLEPILEATLFGDENNPAAASKLTEDSQSAKLVAFLESGDASLKLFLWRRLQNAYQSISYTPKVVSSQLRAIETIVLELKSKRYAASTESHRQVAMLKWLRDVDDIIAKVLIRCLNEANPFECVDEGHLKSSMTAIAELSRLLHGFALFEDGVRIGQINAPVMKSASSTKSFEKSKDRLREMQVRAWTIQYLLLKEATLQCKDKFESPADNLVDYLRSVHNGLGTRQYCRYSSKTFLKLAKSELLAVQTEEDYSADVAQVLFDLYQMKFSPGFGDFDHGCPPETLDKKTALQLVPVVMLQANRLNIKDFQKSELKSTIEKIQQALGAVKTSQSLTHNKRTISAFLKSQINPKELYRSVKGVGDLPTRPVEGDSALIAGTGWFFLLGHISLAKFKSVKRVNATPADELDLAATFFRHDLEHGTEKWETWYRLAQVYEAKIEDDVIWNSTKLNENRSDIALLERNSIHSFSMAIAVAMRDADNTPETSQKITNMFSEFAVRLYSSTREPLNMEAFKTDKSVRLYSRESDQQMYKAPAFRPLQKYSAWSFAAHLLRRNFTPKQKHWQSYYYLGKSLWKMLIFELEQAQLNPSYPRKTTADHVLYAFTAAINALPAKSEKASDYILEPHFKIVSIVHKMVHRNLLSPKDGVDYLQATPYARKCHLTDDDLGNPDWDRYILDVLKKLGAADKSNWHHRIIARAAHVIYDDQQDIAGALGAKHEFTQQIFTKTMTLQVWKPEFERPGRHYVYTGRYVFFFVRLLDQLNDRAGMDQLVRRIRKKPGDFLDHPKIWEEVCTVYVRMMRRVGKVTEGYERKVFEGLGHEEFVTMSGELEPWCHDPDNSSLLLDVLRDAVELKKLNNGLLKGGVVDELVGDAYAAVYEVYVSQFPKVKEDETKDEAVPQLHQPQTGLAGGVSTMNAPAEGIPMADGRMKLGHLLTQTDGPGESHAMRPLIGMGLGVQGAPIMIGKPSPEVVAGQSAPLTVQTSVPPLPPAKPGRVKTVTKTEVRRLAEKLIVKPPPIKTPVLSKKPLIEIESSPFRRRGSEVARDVEAAIDRDREIDVDGDADGDGDGDGDGDETIDEGEASERRGSVHDSADDESELSEVEDDNENEIENDEDQDGKEDAQEEAGEKGKRKSLFPGLMAKMGGIFGRFSERNNSTGAEELHMRHEDRDERDVDEAEGGELEIQDSQENRNDD